jgi:hypothetical protein
MERSHMSNYFRIAALPLLITIGAANIANAGLSDQPIVYKSGQWDVRKSVDSMTDKVTCTGVHRKSFGYQVSADALYLNVRGSLKSVTLRYGNNKPEPLRLATDLERDISSMILKGGEFRKLLTVNRLRTQSLTYLDSLDSKDINLSGINKVVAFIKAGCKVTPSGIPKPDTKTVDGSHSHGGRSHSHPLPAQGIKHRHGNGEFGK